MADIGYDSSSSTEIDLQHPVLSASYESDSRDVTGSPALICAVIEARNMPFVVEGRTEEEESELRQFADILANLNEVRVASSFMMIPAGGCLRESIMKNADSISKKKRRRTSPEQLRILEGFFETNKMPSQATRQKLAEKLSMSTRRVQIWFQNKRAKLKRTGSSGDSDERDSLPGSPIVSSSADDAGLRHAPLASGPIDFASFALPIYSQVHQPVARYASGFEAHPAPYAIAM